MCEIDWFHRDCTEDHCYWMVPRCQEYKKRALAIDPDKHMTFEELEERLYEDV